MCATGDTRQFTRPFVPTVAAPHTYHRRTKQCRMTNVPLHVVTVDYSRCTVPSYGGLHRTNPWLPPLTIARRLSYSTRGRSRPLPYFRTLLTKRDSGNMACWGVYVRGRTWGLGCLETAGQPNESERVRKSPMCLGRGRIPISLGTRPDSVWSRHEAGIQVADNGRA